MARTYDAIVIGAGVIGASIAFHLTRAGAGRVALVERRTVCSGNTRKSGAIVRMHYTNDAEARLALFSLPYFKHWAEFVGGDCGFRQTGFALLVGPENVERLKRNVERLRALGVETTALGPDDLREVMPSIRTDGVAAGAYEPLSGYADPIATTRSLVDAAVAGGADLLEETPVRSLIVVGGRVAGVETSAGRLDAPVVVCAANTWSPSLLATADVALPVTPRRAPTAYFERPSAHVGPHLVLLDTTTAMYTRANGDRQILGGAADVTGAAPTDPDYYDESADPDFDRPSWNGSGAGAQPVGVAVQPGRGRPVRHEPGYARHPRPCAWRGRSLHGGRLQRNRLQEGAGHRGRASRSDHDRSVDDRRPRAVPPVALRRRRRRSTATTSTCCPEAGAHSF